MKFAIIALKVVHDEGIDLSGEGTDSIIRIFEDLYEEREEMLRSHILDDFSVEI